MSGKFKKLLSHFGKSSGTIEKAQEKPADNSGKINLINSWINSISSNLEEKIAELKTRQGSLAQCFDARISTEFDFDNLTRKDFVNLKPSLSKLYDICQKQDVEINLDGFDLLPRVSLTSMSSFTHEYDKGQFMISINASKPFNHVINPFSDKDLQEALKTDEKLPNKLPVMNVASNPKK